MKLEREIEQSVFKNEYEKLLMNIMVTNNYIINNLTQLFESYEVTLQHYNILRILRGAKKPLTILEIKKKLIDKNSDTSRVIDRMKAKNLVEKLVDNSDKRLVAISITQKGEKILLNIDKVEHKFFDMFKNITENEAASMSLLLETVRTKMPNTANSFFEVLGKMPGDSI